MGSMFAFPQVALALWFIALIHGERLAPISRAQLFIIHRVSAFAKQLARAPGGKKKDRNTEACVSHNTVVGFFGFFFSICFFHSCEANLSETVLRANGPADVNHALGRHDPPLFLCCDEQRCSMFRD